MIVHSRARITVLTGPTLGALFPCGGPIQDPVLTPISTESFAWYQAYAVCQSARCKTFPVGLMVERGTFLFRGWYGFRIRASGVVDLKEVRLGLGDPGQRVHVAQPYRRTLWLPWSTGPPYAGGKSWPMGIMASACAAFSSGVRWCRLDCLRILAYLVIYDPG